MGEAQKNVYELAQERLKVIFNEFDNIYVSFSGGKDSAVLLDLVKKALPKGSFVVIFGDTGMEFPDTYEAVEETKKQCEADGTPFYIARSHFEPKDGSFLVRLPEYFAGAVAYIKVRHRL